MIDSSPIRIRTNLQPRNSLTDFTPFISVFFLLVFFFMLSSSFIQISGIAVDLPPGNTKMYDVKKMVVTVTADNKIYFDDAELDSVNEFKNRLASMKSREQGTLLLRADSKASYGIVAEIMAVAEELNVNVILPTAKEALPAPVFTKEE
ncbi:MAG: biopolymer transporter ExbD [Lentisphaeria bacterium]|nr:biopolymer transporter ExbD [Lentisphaeria bacterium]